jgi:hypothetical protein
MIPNLIIILSFMPVEPSRTECACICWTVEADELHPPPESGSFTGWAPPPGDEYTEHPPPPGDELADGPQPYEPEHDAPCPPSD